MSVLSDTTLNPLLLQSELSVKQEEAEWEVNEINNPSSRPKNLGLNPALNSPLATQSSTSNVTTTIISSSSFVEPNLSKAFATAANIPVSLNGSISSSSLNQLASGPGKRVYSRLYNGLLNPYPEVDFFQAFHHTYANSGLLGIAITVTPEFASMVPRVLASQLDKISRTHTRGGITESQLRPA
ncbi:hypothetical protein PPACK8108_LOCUS19382 [Phakopsora pachyrhizi]|uniref:Uncharacterized protein n=1 Tax=Phakopsora pachyrhizi TaxID=170000 RepID=A0AAV0BGC1_PHAPC|nr:hypothetical protein PPACK8108_LOCUS19382 [Phakopsora pachyrhizi]